MIYGFDLGRRTGVAWIGPTGVDSTTWNFTNFPEHARIFLDMWIKLERLMTSAERPELVVYEEPHTRMSKAWAAIFFGQRSLLLTACEKWQVPWVPVHTSEWKRFAGMSGNAKKEEVRKVGAKRWPDFVPRQDELDARFIALAGRSAHGL